jgi:hypothetical protein
VAHHTGTPGNPFGKMKTPDPHLETNYVLSDELKTRKCSYLKKNPNCAITFINRGQPPNLVDIMNLERPHVRPKELYRNLGRMGEVLEESLRGSAQFCHCQRPWVTGLLHLRGLTSRIVSDPGSLFLILILQPLYAW